MAIIIYYKYIDIQYPEQVRKWQFDLCQRLGLKGRILIAHEGINGTLGGDDTSLQEYITQMGQHPLFGGIDFKFSEGGAEQFPRLRVVVRPEIVSTGMPKEITAQTAGKHLTPEQTHELFNEKPDNLVILDTRNWYESKVGTFEGAITPDIKAFRELPAYIDTHLDEFKDKKVFMFCTAGVRCERASAYLKSKNVTQEVYQLQGGIHRYVEQFPEGHFRGKNYVFDGRVTTKANEDVLSQCSFCSVACDEYVNCANSVCNIQFIVCAQCKQKTNTCTMGGCFVTESHYKKPFQPGSSCSL
jgi:predicted sulfurtransferase